MDRVSNRRGGRGVAFLIASISLLCSFCKPHKLPFTALPVVYFFFLLYFTPDFPNCPSPPWPFPLLYSTLLAFCRRRRLLLLPPTPLLPRWYIYMYKQQENGDISTPTPLCLHYCSVTSQRRI